jgi:hypothetical protein
MHPYNRSSKDIWQEMPTSLWSPTKAYDTRKFS